MASGWHGNELVKLCDEHLLASAQKIATRWEHRQERMSALVDLLWETFSSDGLSWVGFYLDGGDTTSDSRLVLGPRRDTPACSPIGMHGACGRCFLSGHPLIVSDVRDLGDRYIACDPRDQRELVIPCFEPSGRVWGVLDLDSHRIGYFGERSAIDLEHMVVLAGISRRE